MKWYHYLIIGIVVAIIIAILIIFIAYKVSKSNKAKSDNKLASEYVEILDYLGNKDNIIEVSSNGSRLSFALKDISKVNEEKLKEKGITGIIKTSKKITLVIGDLASKIKETIEKEIQD